MQSTTICLPLSSPFLSVAATTVSINSCKLPNPFSTVTKDLNTHCKCHDKGTAHR